MPLFQAIYPLLSGALCPLEGVLCPHTFRGSMPPILCIVATLTASPQDGANNELYRHKTQQRSWYWVLNPSI